MKKRMSWLFAGLLVLSMLLVLGGCAEDEPVDVDVPDDEENGEEAPDDAATVDTQFLSIATGGTGGVYYPYGGGVSTVLNREVPYLRASTEVTGASVENIVMIAEGTAELATVMNDVLYQAYHAEGRFEDDPQDVRSVFLMYPHHFHVVVLDDTDVYDIYDIEGKRVSVGAPGSGTEFKTDLVLSALGISYDDMDIMRLPFAETGEDLRDGRIDVGFWDVAAPTSSIMEITATRDIRLINFTDEQMETILSEYPFYSRFEMPPETYPNQDEPIVNPSVWNTVIASADYPEDFVYDITKAVFENQEHLIAIHHFAEYSTPENALEHAVVPFHPGAVRYFEEAGFDVPDELIPPEMQ